MDRSRMLQELDEVLDDTGCQHTAWSASAKLGYLEEGQEKFCEDTGFFVDNTNFSVTTVPGQAVYEVDPRIISILGIYDGARRLAMRPLRLQEAGAENYQLAFNYESNSSLEAYQPDLEAGLITLLGTPRDERTLRLRVWRYPMFALSNDDIDGAGTPASPELPNRLQRACIEWAAFKCLSHHDREQQDPVKAADHLALYTGYVSDGKKYLRRLRGEVVDVRPNPVYQVC